MQNRPPGIYTTPAKVLGQMFKANTGTTDSTETRYGDEWALALRYCRAYSKIIEEKTNRTFVPYRETKTVYFATEIRENRFYYDSGLGCYMLELEDDLLAIDSLTWDETELTDEYRTVGLGNSADEYPYTRILFNGSSAPAYDTDFDTAIEIEGEWGVHDSNRYDYSDITIITAAIDDTTSTSVSVADDEGALFEVYQYIRIDDELMLITDIDSSGDPDILTVERGVNGFTAAIHDNGSTIKRWNVVRDVEELGTRIVAYFMQKRSDTGEYVTLVDGSLIVARFNEEIASIANDRRRSLMGVG